MRSFRQTAKYPRSGRNAAAGSFVCGSGEFKTGSATYAADFSTMTVAENRGVSSSRLIHLPVIRIRSKAKTPLDPVFGLAGGPGVSNMKWMPPDSLLEQHDFVMVGYRGVDGSSVLDCPDVVKALKTGDDLLSDRSLRRIGKAWTRSAQRLAASGVDLDGYTMKEVVEDIEIVRQKLGHDRINFLSESYGTRLAYTYGLVHPGNCFRSVMIGANPPGRFVWEPHTADAQLRRYAELWAADRDASRRSTDLVASMRNVLDNMPRRWLFFGINPGKVKVVTFALLFHRKTAAMAFDAYLAAEKGDASGLALMSMASDFVVPSLFTWGDLASKAFGADFDAARNYAGDMIPPDAVLGSPLGKLLWGAMGYGRWPVSQLPPAYRTLQYSDVQTLILSGSNDFSTPAEYATDEFLPHLRNGRQIILSELGHVADIWKIRPRATERLVTSFFRTGIADASLVEHVPMDFRVRWGFPRLAKTVFGIAAAVAVLAAGTVWLVSSIY